MFFWMYDTSEHLAQSALPEERHTWNLLNICLFSLDL